MNDPAASSPPTVALTLARSMVKIRAEVSEDAFTASILGTQRSGNGVIIADDGLILTIGYLITEARDVWLTTHDGVELAGHALAYDQVTGFGLVLPLGPLAVAPLVLGNAELLRQNDSATVLCHPQFASPLAVTILARREFAGAWEYLLDEAIFTLPAHEHWSGAALVDNTGHLVGLGSLLVRETIGGKETDANLFVSTDLLKPILDDLRKRGRAARPPRPWLGLYATQHQHTIMVSGIIDGGPAQKAGLNEGDLIREVGDREVSSMAEFYRAVWASGHAGSIVTLTTTRSGKPSRVKVHSVDRSAMLWHPVSH